MASKKKVLTSVVALGTAAALTLGGTFAWQSINQTALNEASDVINPGGRLHDDFDGSNKDIYVENFTDPDNGGQDIFARIHLEEYFEIIMNYGVEGVEKSTVLLGSKEENTDEATMAAQPYTYTYEIYKFDGNKNEDGSFRAAVKDDTSWWNWSVGNENSAEKYYMPTFNLNKDSLVADTNGNYVDAVGGISSRDGTQYENYVEYAAGDEKTDTEIYDGDSNDADEVGTDFENLANYAANIVTRENQTHAAKLLDDTTALISMEEYLALGQDTGNYWVYDTDGWVYWANPIKPGETTGRLLDGIALNQVMDDTWYYAINVVAQFVTANDVGKADGTGFYDTENGTAPSENAETLLRNIGVELGESAVEPEPDPEPDEKDTTAPTFVSAENPSGSNNSMTWNMTISGLSTGDFPLTLKGYYLDSEDSPISGEPYFTSEIIVEEDAVSANITCADQYTVSFNDGSGTYDADTGTLNLSYHWMTGNVGKYAALTVTDASGNTGSLPNSVWVASGRGCFTAGTQVSSPNGMVNIEDIAAGDQVYSLDLASGEKVAVTVLKVHDQWVNDEFYHITVGSETITATPEHLFYVDGEWVEARALSVSDTLVSMNGAADTAITAIVYEKLDTPITVYNLTVSGDHNFLITGNELVTHNVSK